MFVWFEGFLRLEIHLGEKLRFVKFIVSDFVDSHFPPQHFWISSLNLLNGTFLSVTLQRKERKKEEKNRTQPVKSVTTAIGIAFILWAHHCQKYSARLLRQGEQRKTGRFVISYSSFFCERLPIETICFFFVQTAKWNYGVLFDQKTHRSNWHTETDVSERSAESEREAFDGGRTIQSTK